MNILIFNWRDPKHPNAGGAEVVTQEYAKAWVQNGHRVMLFSSFYTGAKEKETIDGVEIIRKGSHVFGVQIQALLWYLYATHPSFDLVIDQFHGIPFFTPLYVRTKKVAFIHEVAKEVWKLNTWAKPFHIIPQIIGSLGEEWIFKIMYKNIPFLTVSESTKIDLMEWGIPEKNITIIHNGVRVPHVTTFPAKEKKKTVLFLGAIAQDKGIEDMLKIFSVIKKREQNWQFWVAGNCDPRYMKKLKQVAKQLGVEDIIFWGYVSEKKKFDLLTKAHILLNPSIREGWGLVNIEANAMGTPVAAYDVPGCRDSVKNGKTGILVPLGEYSRLADEIIDLVIDNEKYEKFRKNAIMWSKQFRWEDSTQKSLTFLGKI